MKMPVGVEIAALSPLTGWALLNALVVTYTPLITLGVTLLVAGLTLFWRRREHLAIMRKNGEADE